MWSPISRVPPRLSFDGAPILEVLRLLTLGPNDPLAQLFEWKEFVHIFFIVYPRFTDKNTILSHISQQFQGAKSTWEKNTILYLVELWGSLDRGADFKSEEEFLREFDAFCDVVGADSKFSLRAILLRKIPANAKFAISEKIVVNTNVAPSPQLPTGSYTSWTISSFDPLEVARQLTLRTQEIFRRLKRFEFLFGGWYQKTEKKRQALAPELIKYVNDSNRTTRWVTTEILKRRSLSDRTRTIEFFISVAKNLEQLRNYDGLMQVLSSLHSSTIGKLKQSWININKKSQEQFDRLTELMSNLGHYKNYTEAFGKIPESTPAIPFVSMVLQDLFLLEDNMEDTLDEFEDFVNWSKFNQMGTMIRNLTIERPPYQLLSVQAIQRFFDESEVWMDEDILYEVAKLQESATEDETSSAKPFFSANDLWDDAGLSEDELKKLWSTPSSETKTFPAGEILLDVGDIPLGIYKILSGNVAVYPGSSMDAVSHRYSAGQFFGEVCLVHEQNTVSCRVVAETEVTLTLTPRDAVYQVVDSSGGAAYALYFASTLAWKVRSSPAIPNPELSLLPTHEEVLKKNFSIPPADFSVAYACSLSGNNYFTPGTLYLCKNSFFFYGNLFGTAIHRTFTKKEAKKVIQAGPNMMKIVLGAGQTVKFDDIEDLATTLQVITRYLTLPVGADFLSEPVSSHTSAPVSGTATPGGVAENEPTAAIPAEGGVEGAVEESAPNESLAHKVKLSAVVDIVSGENIIPFFQRTNNLSERKSSLNSPRTPIALRPVKKKSSQAEFGDLSISVPPSSSTPRSFYLGSHGSPRSPTHLPYTPQATPQQFVGDAPTFTEFDFKISASMPELDDLPPDSARLSSLSLSNSSQGGVGGSAGGGSSKMKLQKETSTSELLAFAAQKFVSEGELSPRFGKSGFLTPRPNDSGTEGSHESGETSAEELVDGEGGGEAGGGKSSRGRGRADGERTKPKKSSRNASGERTNRRKKHSRRVSGDSGDKTERSARKSRHTKRSRKDKPSRTASPRGHHSDGFVEGEKGSDLLVKESLNPPTMDDTLITSLPYVDTNVPYTPEVQAEVQRMVEEEMRTFVPSPDYLEHLPVADVAFEDHPLLQAEWERVSNKQALVFDTSKYVPHPPASAESKRDVNAWLQSVQNAKAQVQNKAIQIENLELLKAYGANAWKAHIEELNQVKKTLGGELKAVKREVGGINAARKTEQIPTGKRLVQLEQQKEEMIEQIATIRPALTKLQEEINALQNGSAAAPSASS
eukprot:TRINITY_DN2042_c0_g1_i3.p1 TRINITY_DN2042_c0_g1~~TRINITY_DN2042_c0_g1_i3.p1  ORF type:complete len:1421 (+),score=346.70 TRINITY_DN2042_c0_g1_i3:484-4263(+)